MKYNKINIPLLPSKINDVDNQQRSVHVFGPIANR